MSQKKVVKPVETPKKNLAPTTSKTNYTETNSTVSTSNNTLIFNRQNYTLMFVGALLIFGGLLLMIGGQQPDANTWDPNIIYSTRITLIAPAVIIAGLIVEVIAIFKQS